MERREGLAVVAVALVWAGVILGTAVLLRGSPRAAEVLLLEGAGSAATVLILGGALRDRDENV